MKTAVADGMLTIGAETGGMQTTVADGMQTAVAVQQTAVAVPQ